MTAREQYEQQAKVWCAMLDLRCHLSPGVFRLVQMELVRERAALNQMNQRGRHERTPGQ